MEEFLRYFWMREKIVQAQYWWCSAFFYLWLLNSIQKSLIRKPGITPWRNWWGFGLWFSKEKKLIPGIWYNSAIMLPSAPLVCSKLFIIYSLSLILLSWVRHFSSHPYLFGKHWFQTFYFISSCQCLWGAGIQQGWLWDGCSVTAPSSVKGHSHKSFVAAGAP